MNVSLRGIKGLRFGLMEDLILCIVVPSLYSHIIGEVSPYSTHFGNRGFVYLGCFHKARKFIWTDVYFSVINHHSEVNITLKNKFEGRKVVANWGQFSYCSHYIQVGLHCNRERLVQIY